MASADSLVVGRKFTIPLVIPEETETGDGRVFKKNSIEFRELPLPLLWQIKTSDGHDGSVVVGRIDHMERVDSGFGNAYGVFDTGAYGREAQRMIENGFIRGVSADLDKFEASEDDEDDSDDDLDAAVEKIEKGKKKKTEEVNLYTSSVVLNNILTIKRAGDYSQIWFCKRYNDIKSNEKLFFMSNDRMSASFCLLEEVPFVCLIRNYGVYFNPFLEGPIEGSISYTQYSIKDKIKLIQKNSK